MTDGYFLPYTLLLRTVTFPTPYDLGVESQPMEALSIYILLIEHNVLQAIKYDRTWSIPDCVQTSTQVNGKYMEYS